jgi:hypothetical protein
MKPIAMSKRFKIGRDVTAAARGCCDASFEFMKRQKMTTKVKLVLSKFLVYEFFLGVDKNPKRT